MKKKPRSTRDIEKGYSKAQYVAKLRRLADAIEGGRRFEIRVAGERVRVPAGAKFTVEHEVASDGEEEIEFQLRWNRTRDETA